MIDGNIDILSLQGDIVDTVSLEGNLLPIGPKGDKGDDGFSPVVTTSKSGKTTTIKFETATGNVYAYVQDGEDGQGSGDMLTDVYDQNKNGIVDNAEKVNNHTVLTDVPENAVFTDTTYTAGTGIDITNNVISNTSTNATWGDITGTLSEQTDLQNALDLKANTSAIPTKVSDLQNDSGFIDKTVNNLTNYYTTANTYNKNEINILIGQIQQFKIQVVQTLPVSDIDTHTIYLVPKTGSGNDVYNEYLYINNAWELIGDTTVDLSNYYTKSETDTLLGAKANSSDLATVATSGSYNDLSNKPTIPDELADLSDDSTHRLVSDTEKTTWNNKVDSTGDATTTGENTSFSLTNVLEAPLLIDLKGNTSQNTLSGKNLFDTNNLTLNTLSGLTSSIKDATLKLNGTNSSQGYIITTSSTGVVLPAGTYTLSMVVKGTCNILGTNYNTVLYLLNGNTNASFHNMSFRTTYYNSSKTQSSQFTLTDPTPISVQMYTNGSVAYNNIEIMMQIESGSSFTGFEPYCGGVPSPNPSYTQNVNVVSGDNDIVVCGKNLFDKSDNILTGKYYDNTTGEIKTTTTANNYLQEIYIKVTPNTQYTISAGANCQYLRMVEYNINKTFIKTNTSDTSNTMTRTLTENTQYVRLSMAGENVLDTLQLEKGSTATTYTPYTGTTYPVNLPVENLCNGINQNIWISGSYDLVGIGTSNSGLIIPANGGYYTISTTETQSRYRACCVDTLPTSGQNVPGYNGVLYDNTKRVITINTSGHNYLVVDATDLTKVQIEQGSKANTYTPYGTTPIELCKIGTYQDYIYKENDKWYLHKEIGKVDMSSITGYDGANGQFYKTGFVSGYGIKNDTLYSNIFLYSTTTWLDLHFGITSTGNLWLSTGDTTLTPSTINTWLSNKNAILYGILTTPTNTEITYQPLLNQLNALEDAESYEGTTNINQINNDLPFIIDATAFNNNYNGRYRSLKYMYDKISAGGNN